MKTLKQLEVLELTYNEKVNVTGGGLSEVTHDIWKGIGSICRTVRDAAVGVYAVLYWRAMKNTEQ